MTSEPEVIKDKKHAKLSPSGAKRWMSCPGSIPLNAQLNPNNERRSSRFAAEGTVAHEIGDKCLSDKTRETKPSDFVFEQLVADGFAFRVTHEMVDAVEVYVDYVREQAEEHDATLEAEVWGSLEVLEVPGLTGGTTDALVINYDDKIIHVIDFKYGQGVAVDVIDNPQLMCYGLGAIIKLDQEGIDLSDWTVKLVIVQPRAFHPDGRIREWELPAQELGSWGVEVLKPAGLLANQHDAPFKATDEGCRFCDASGNCTELEKRTQELAVIDFDDIDDTEPENKFPPIPILTPEQKLNIMEHAGAIKAFIIAVENQIKIDMESGSKDYDNHLKLVRKVTRRKLDEDCADPDFSPLLDVLSEEQAFTKKVKGITVLEKELKKELGVKAGKEFLAEYIIKPEGAIVVAKLDDKRKAVEPSAKRDFTDMEDD